MTLSALLVRLLRLRQGPPAPSRLAPGIRCEVTIVLGDNGLRGIVWSKLNPGDNVDAVFGLLIGQLLQLASTQGASVDFETGDGASIPLVRPSTAAIPGQVF